MVAYKLPYTIEDYQMWEGDWELINGDAIAMAPSPFGPHQAIMSEIIFQLKTSLQKCLKSCFIYPETDYIIDDLNVFRPDISVVCKKVKEHIITTPIMVVEILSKSTAIKDTTIKFETYQKEGIEFYLIVDYEKQSFKLYQLQNGRYSKLNTDEEFSIKLKECDVDFDSKMWWEAL